MTEKAHKLDATLDNYVQDVKGLFGDELIAVALYGSRARGDFQPKSDVNVLIVLTANGIKNLAVTFPLVKKWAKRGISAPLVLTENYITSSLDAFPIEFLNLKLFHRLLFGRDVLSGLEISDNFLRLKCEEQVKSKLLHVREGFLQTGGKKELMLHLVSSSVPALASIFTGLVVLKKRKPPSTKEGVLLETARLFGLDTTVFQRALDIRKGALRLAQGETVAFLQAYIDELARLADMIDQWKS